MAEEEKNLNKKKEPFFESEDGFWKQQYTLAAWPPTAAYHVGKRFKQHDSQASRAGCPAGPVRSDATYNSLEVMIWLRYSK
jgi:hypothetical protein